MVKNIYKKYIYNIRLNSRKLEAFPLRPGTMQACSPSPSLFNNIREVLASTVRQEKETEDIQTERKDTKLCSQMTDCL